MPRLSKQVKREQVIAALEHIIQNKLELKGSTVHNLIYKGQSFPPKEVIRWAARLAKIPNWESMGLSGGDDANASLKAMGFEIKAKGAEVSSDVEGSDFFKEIIAKYKVHILENGLSEEIYKWELVEKYKGRPYITAIDFTTEIKGINFSNLVYGVGIGVIRHLAQDKPEEYLNCFEVLFDESIELTRRLLSFNEKVTALYRTLEPDIKRSAHHDERTIATILTYRYPEKYTFYKDSFYQSLCKKLGEKARQKGEKYVHYLSIVKDFIANYIKVDDELISLVNSQKSEISYDDPEFMILAQDILYSMLEKQNYDLKNLFEEVKSLISEDEAIPIKMLTVRVENDSKNQWFKCKDSKGIITGSLAHYEVGCSHTSKDLAIALHFENRKNNKLFKEIISDNLPDDYEWFGWYGGYSIRSSVNSFKLDEDDIAIKVINFLEKLDSEIGELVRTVITTEFLKDEFDKTLLKNVNMALNQILYGPPGTGKTYHTINKALAIIENKEETVLAKESREEIKKRYQDYVAKGQIIFTTFHQSMSYEDFVEGIKPEIEEDKDGVRTVVYDVKDGIFKSICKSAAMPSHQSFAKAYSKLVADMAKMEEPNLIILKTPKNKEFAISLNSQGNLSLHTGEKKEKQGVLTKEKLERQLNGEEVFDGWQGYFSGVANYLTTKYNFSKDKSEIKPHVLIIDEINRGNVSAIFGELITLIEESKRAGASEALELTLPYSKDKFSVPSNLYIIGTMNTADRSVEALDTALRRRFAFEEMMPEPMKIATEGALVDGIIGGIDLAKVLTKINERIEVLLDADHQIGHSYLINVADLSGLVNAFNNCIIPLLKEYFYHDDEKIALVLGAGFVNVKKQLENVQALFPQMEGLDIHNIHGKSKFGLKQIHSANIIEALTTLLAGE